MSRHGKREALGKTALGVSPKRIDRNSGRPVVAADCARHDVARFQELQRIHGFVRANRDEYSGGPTEKTGVSRDYRGGARSARRAKAKLRADAKRDRPWAGDDRDGVVGRRARARG